MKAYTVSAAVPGGDLLVTDCATRLDLDLPDSLSAAFQAVQAAHIPGRTVIALSVDEEDVLVSVGLALASAPDPRALLAQAYVQDATALDTLARLAGERDWFSLCSGRRFEPRIWSPEHVGLLSVPEQADGLALFLTQTSGCGVPDSATHFRLAIVDNGIDEPIYDTEFDGGRVTSHVTLCAE